MSEINVKFKRPALEADVVVGSFGELVTLMQAEETTLLKLFGSDMEVIMTALKGDGNTVITEGAVGAVVEGAEAAAGRKSRKSNKAVETATAPAPIAPPATTHETQGTAADTGAAGHELQGRVVPKDDGIPESLRRTTPAAAAPPPPPLLPSAPPVVPAAPAAPPVGVLAQKVIADLDNRAKGSPDGGAALADWLAQYSIVVKGATYDEAISTVRLTPDEKLTAIAGALGVA